LGGGGSWRGGGGTSEDLSTVKIHLTERGILKGRTHKFDMGLQVAEALRECPGGDGVSECEEILACSGRFQEDQGLAWRLSQLGRGQLGSCKVARWLCPCTTTYHSGKAARAKTLGTNLWQPSTNGLQGGPHTGNQLIFCGLWPKEGGLSLVDRKRQEGPQPSSFNLYRWSSLTLKLEKLDFTRRKESWPSFVSLPCPLTISPQACPCPAFDAPPPS
ncbi:hypothetical protein E2320_012463, partial [Naja naja]